MSYPRNNASPERIAVGAVVQISDGAVQTSGVSISVRGQGGASGAGAGTTAYDNGIVQYTPTQGETDFTSFVVVAYKTGCIPASVTVVTSASGTPGVAVVPDTQKVDLNTIKTQTVTCGGGVTVPAATLASTTNITAATGIVLSGVTHTGAVIPTVSVLTGHTPQTGDSYPVVSSLTYGNAALKTLIDDVPTVAEFEARTLLAASYGTVANQSTIAGYLDTEVAAILAAVDTEVAAVKAKTDQLTFTVANQVDANALSGGGGLDAAGVRAAVGLASANLDTQLADIPTVSEFNARTLAAAAYFDPSTDIVTTTDTTNITSILADTNELQTDWANGGRLDLILDARSSQSSVDDIPTNAELATALGTADDAVLAAIGALNNLSQANVRTAVGLGAANLDTQLADLPTVAEFEARTLLAAAYGTAANQATIAGYLDTEVAAILAAVDTEVAAIKAKTDQLTFTVANQVDANAMSGGGGLDAAGVRAAVGLASANLDTQLADIPTVSEFNARTLAAAAYFDPSTDIVTTTDTTNITAILADTNELQSDWANNGRLDLILDARASQTSVDDIPTNAELATALGTADDAVLAAIAALNNLSAAQVNTECDTALSDAGVTTARMAALTDWIDGGRLDLLLDAILDDTGTAGVALSAAICNKVADHVRRRTQANVEASSDGDTLSLFSLYGAIQQMQESNTTDTPGLLTVKKTDGTTTLGTRTLATDAGSDPVTGVS